MNKPITFTASLLAGFVLLIPLPSTRAQDLSGVISNPVTIPLVVEALQGTGEKLGIWASIGGGSAPQLF